jgi:4-hydroxysphinganine ceramide fatty acyl 2-hydroxylase
MNYQYLKRRYHSWFTKTRAAPALLTYLAVFIFIYWQLRQTAFSGLLLVAGWLQWTLMEYLLHRFLFHYKTRNRHLKFLRYLLHDVHHQSPANTLFLPLLVRWFTLLQTGFLCQYVAGLQGYFFFAGYVWGMLYYMLVHWLVHLRQTPAPFRHLKRHHLHHHLQNHHAAFGVTTTFWDWFFNTLPASGETILSAGRKAFYYQKS